MSHKTRNTIILLVFLIVISIIGVYLTFIHQKKQIKNINTEIEQLNVKFTNIQQMRVELKKLVEDSRVLDSVLMNSKKIIPYKKSMTDTYNDLIKLFDNFSEKTKIDIEYEKTDTATNARIDVFSLKGVGEYEDLYNFIYNVEKNRKLYKISNLSISNAVVQSENSGLDYLVNFNMKVNAYYTTDTSLSLNYNLSDEISNFTVVDVFYPLILPEIPPNYDNLLEVDGAQLLAIFSDGVFILDKRGITHSLQEGDEVYLGQLTKIDYLRNQVEFILNKGGLVEKVVLGLKANIDTEVKK